MAAQALFPRICRLLEWMPRVDDRLELPFLHQLKQKPQVLHTQRQDNHGQLLLGE